MFDKTGEYDHRASGGFVEDVHLVVAAKLEFPSVVILGV